MLATAASTFFIHTIGTFHGFSAIHLLSIAVIAGCIRAVAAARRGDIRTHRAIMRGLYVGGIGIAGVFTLYPGRLMHRLVFGVPDVFLTPGRSTVGRLVEGGAAPAVLAALAAVALVLSAVAAVRAWRAGRRPGDQAPSAADRSEAS